MLGLKMDDLTNIKHKYNKRNNQNFKDLIMANSVGMFKLQKN